jgi:hypothetical protein
VVQSEQYEADIGQLRTHLTKIDEKLSTLHQPKEL